MATITPFLPLVWLFLILLFVIPAFPRHKGVLIAVLFGMLFLPEVGSGDAAKNASGVLKIGIYVFSKERTIVYALLLTILIYDIPLLLASRPGLVDLPMLIWCLCPIASVLTNEPPPDGGSMARDCVSNSLAQTLTWGVPYLAGRLYFTNQREFRDLALGMVLAALVYVPLCLVELKMSPILHSLVFGFMQHQFAQSVRLGGYRPMVFFQHGLALAFFMISATVVAGWLAVCWKRDSARQFFGYSLLLLAPLVVLLKSMAALLLGVLGFGILYLMKTLPSRLWLILLVAVPILYVAGRSSGVWTGRGLVELIKEHGEADRALSLEFRLDNEDMLIEKALRQPLFGWGGWGRNRVTDDEDNDIAITDGLWIMVLGTNGFFGLIALGTVMLLPPVLLICRFPPKSLSQEAVAPVVVFAMILVLWTMDCLLNAMITPLNILLAGALAWVDPKRFVGVEQSPLAASWDRLPAAYLELPARRANRADAEKLTSSHLSG